MRKKNEEKLKVIIHYLNGESFTHKDYSIKFISWLLGTVSLEHQLDHSTKNVYLTEDTLAISIKDGGSLHTYFNPRYEGHIGFMVTTKRQWAKLGRSFAAKKAAIGRVITGLKELGV